MISKKLILLVISIYLIFNNNALGTIIQEYIYSTAPVFCQRAYILLDFYTNSLKIKIIMRQFE